VFFLMMSIWPSTIPLVSDFSFYGVLNFINLLGVECQDYRKVSVCMVAKF